MRVLIRHFANCRSSAEHSRIPRIRSSTSRRSKVIVIESRSVDPSGSSPCLGYSWTATFSNSPDRRPHAPRVRGGGQALIDLLGGQVQVMFNSLPASIEYIKAGTLRALAVASTTHTAA